MSRVAKAALARGQAVGSSGLPAGIDIPVYVNPAALRTVKDLRTALERTNLQLAEQSNRVALLQKSLVQMASDISPLVVAQIQGKPDLVQAELLRFITKHVQVIPRAALTASH